MKLLDALESFVAERGTASLSHRVLAKAAGVRPGLIHYHFGTLDHAIEEAVARRASELADAQLASIAHACARSRCSAADLVAAWWKPFEDLARRERYWCDYFCLLARLSSLPAVESEAQRMFAPVLQALRAAALRLHPEAEESVVDAALAHVWTLFEREILMRLCPAERDNVPHTLPPMIPFAAAGFETLLRTRFAAPSLAR